MDAVRRSRFASRQMRAGPAPLASFEDLPSDELESPEDYSHLKTNALDDESVSRDLQFATPDSLTVSSQSTPRIESDFDSHFTLTPGGDSYQGQSTSELRTASLSSLSKEDSALNVKQKKGSAVSLGILETTEVEYTHRKSSWTDIFRSHNQTSAKTSSTTSQQGLSEKTVQKKSKTDHYKKETTPEKKSKDKGKFLSIFKKKSNKLTNSPVSSDNHILPNESSNVTECLSDLPEDVVATKVSNIKVSKGKENESPIDEERNQIPCEIQNDLGKVNSDRPNKIPDERRLNRKVINIPEKVVDKEYNIVSQQIDQKNGDKLSKVENIQAIVEVSIEEQKNVDILPKTDNIVNSVNEEDTVDDNKDDKNDSESPECELTTESVDATIEKKEDDFEAEILLPQDLSEMDDEPVVDLHPVIEVSKQIMIPSKQQRLEITTKPIDRPRSTTPINVASLEAFIQSVSPTFDGKVEKIKLSLPGEQFVGRIKSPKRSSLKSWTDFCERGLHSPRMHRKFDKDSPKNPFESSDGAIISDNPQFSSENWAAFDSRFTVVESNVFDDSFSVDFGAAETSPRDQSKTSFESSYQYFESDFSCSSISSECPSCSKFSSFGPNDAQSSDQSVSSALCEDCSCQCHSKQKSSVKSPEHCSNINAFGASEILSLVNDNQF